MTKLFHIVDKFHNDFVLLQKQKNKFQYASLASSCDIYNSVTVFMLDSKQGQEKNIKVQSCLASCTVY